MSEGKGRKGIAGSGFKTVSLIFPSLKLRPEGYTSLTGSPGEQVFRELDGGKNENGVKK